MWAKHNHLDYIHSAQHIRLGYSLLGQTLLAALMTAHHIVGPSNFGLNYFGRGMLVPDFVGFDRTALAAVAVRFLFPKPADDCQSAAHKDCRPMARFAADLLAEQENQNQKPAPREQVAAYNYNLRRLVGQLWQTPEAQTILQHNSTDNH